MNCCFFIHYSFLTAQRAGMKEMQLNKGLKNGNNDDIGTGN